MSTQLYNKFLSPTAQGVDIHSEIVNVTPELAAQWLNQHQFEYQRNLRSWHVDFLAKEMQKGRFLPGTQIRISINGDGPKIVDGNHRLHAVIKSNTTQAFSVLYAYEAPSIAYTRTDRGLGRTTDDAYSAVQLADELGLGKEQLQRTGYAVKLIHGDFVKSKAKSNRLSDEDLADILREYGNAASNYFEAIAGYPAEMRAGLLRAATMAIALSTFQFASSVYGAVKVETFWSGVAFDNGLTTGDPRKTANRHIMNVNMPVGQSRITKNMVSPAFSARYIAGCWNAWVEGREIKYSKVPDEKSKINILGTPFNGK